MRLEDAEPVAPQCASVIEPHESHQSGIGASDGGQVNVATLRSRSCKRGSKVYFAAVRDVSGHMRTPAQDP